MGKGKGNNKGFSLVELLCAIAIFALVVTTAGAVMVFTSRSYRNSTSETSVQQEAQFAANRIGGLIQDATNVTFKDNVMTIEKGEDADGACTITLGDSANADRAGRLFYNGNGIEQVLAENIERFAVNATKFKDTKTVELEMDVYDGIRKYNVAYTMTARNDEVTISAGDGTVTPVSLIKVGSPRVIMVPGESDLGIDDIELINVEKLEAESSSTALSATVDGVSLKLSLDKSAKAADTPDEYTVTLIGKDAEGQQRAKATITVAVRRVESIDMWITSSADSDGKKIYTFHAKPQGTNFAKVPGARWDENYKNPYRITEEIAKGTNYYITDKSGNITGDDPHEFFEAPIVSYDEASKETTIKFKQIMSLNSDMKFHVKVSSKHSDGENKANSNYGPVYGNIDLEGVGFKKTDDIQVILDPGQTEEIEIKGLDKGEWDCAVDYEGSGGSIAAGTTFGVEGNKLKIAIGKDEKGYKTSTSVFGEDKGNIIINVRAKGSNAKEDIAVRVLVGIRRVEEIQLKVKQLISPGDGEGHNVKEPYKTGADYQFYTELTGTHLPMAELAGMSDTDKAEAVKANPYMVEFYWEFYVKNVRKESGTLKWDKVYNTGGSYTDGSMANDSYDKYKIVDLGVNGNNPCINFMLKDEFPTGGELRVTAKALHAYGENRGNASYNNGVSDADKNPHLAVASIVRDEELIIVEPNQGADNSAADLIVPINFTNDANAVSVKFVGKSSGDTDLIDSEDNPQKTSDLKKWFIVVHIGRDERGTDGIFTMDVIADSGETKTITFAVRRVEDIELKAKNNSGDNFNAAGGQISITAEVKGCASVSAKESNYYPYYFKNSGESNYKDPCSIEWAYSVNNGQKWKTLISVKSYDYENGTRYDVSDDYVEYVKLVKSGDDDYNQRSIELHLKQPLPGGTLIRAHSLHAGNPNSSNERDGSQNLNKSEIYYAVKGEKDEYGGYGINGYYKIKSSVIPISASSMMRGKDEFDFTVSVENDPKVNYPSDMDQNKNNLRKWYMRVREVTYDADGKEQYTPWSKYRRTIQNDYTNKKLNSEETRSFLPDKVYQIEMAQLCIDVDAEIIYWPYDKSLTDAGTGFEGYKTEWTSDKVTQPEDYRVVYQLGTANFQIKVISDNQNAGDGTFANPFIIPRENGKQVGDVQFEGRAFDVAYFHDGFKPHLEHYENGKWVECGFEGLLEISRGYADSSIYWTKYTYRGSNTSADNETYRMSFDYIKNGDSDWSSWTQEAENNKDIRLKNPRSGYVRIKDVNYNSLYNYDSGLGYVYLCIKNL